MNKNEMLQRLFGHDMVDGVIKFQTENPISIFFVVEEISDIGFMMKQALQMIEGNCNRFYFYGKYADLWLKTIDETEILKHPEAEYKSNLLTITYEKIEDFVEKIELELSDQKSVRDCILLYNNKDEYNKVMNSVNAQETMHISTYTGSLLNSLE